MADEMTEQLTKVLNSLDRMENETVKTSTLADVVSDAVTPREDRETYCRITGKYQRYAIGVIRVSENGGVSQLTGCVALRQHSTEQESQT